MSLNFAGLSPHPPIIIPEIGKEDLAKVADTTVALRKLAHYLQEAEIETLIIISPHDLIYPDGFNISAMKKIFGTFAHFDEPNITFEYANDLELVDEIVQEARNNEIPIIPYDNGGEFHEMDHGIMVPLYYLRREQETALKIVPIAYSNLDRAQHFAFGQTIGEVAKKYPGRVGILASGDLGHQLIQNPETKKFDLKFMDDLKHNRVQDILYYDDSMIDNWAECGYRSVLILLGALDGLKAKPELLSYEGPFGVGYGVVNFELKERN